MEHVENKNLKVLKYEEKGVFPAEGKAVMYWEVSVPQLKDGQNLNRINRFYRHTAKIWAERWKKIGKIAGADQKLCAAEGRLFRPWQAGLDSKITYIGEGLLSVRLEAEEVREEGRKNTVSWGDIWDLDKGMPVPLSKLTGRPARWNKRTVQEILRQGRARLDCGDCFLDRNWEDKVKRLLPRLRPCLVEDGLEYGFPQASLAPPAEGILRFTVPCRASAAVSAGTGQQRNGEEGQGAEHDNRKRDSGNEAQGRTSAGQAEAQSGSGYNKDPGKNGVHQ